MNQTTKKIKYVLLLAIVFMTTDLLAQTFSMSGEFRPRAETRNGYKKLSPTDSDAAMFISQRSRLNLNYKHDKFKVGLSLQDIRVWGQAKQLNTADGLTSVHQAWGELFLTKKISLKAGRQEIIYDDHRIFGSVGWAQQARSHDAAIIKYSGKKLKVHAGFAFNQGGESLFNTYYALNNYKAFQYLWANYKFKGFGVSILALNNGKDLNDSTAMAANPINTGIETYYNQTIGGRITANPGALGGNFAYYMQMGKDFGGKKDLSANYIAFDIFYKPIKNLKVVAGYERLSGTSTANATAATNNSFTPFYGTNHKFNGHMDYFYVGNHTNSVGLQDIYFTAAYKYKKASVSATYHMFSTAADFDNGNGIMDSNLGSEIDLSAGYAFNKMVNIKAGFSFLNATETLHAIRITDNGDINESNTWGWLMLTFKPQFLEYKKK